MGEAKGRWVAESGSLGGNSLGLAVDPPNQNRQTKRPHKVRGATSLYHIPIGLGRDSDTVRFGGPPTGGGPNGCR